MKHLIFTIIIVFTVSACSTQSYLSQKSIQQPNTKIGLKEVKQALKKPNIPILIEEKASTEKNETRNGFDSKYDKSVNNIIIEAKSYLGTPYRYGGTTRRGIDCSAFMQHIYNVEGIELPRVSANQAKIGIAISRGELQKGDLIFFSTTSPHRITHVGMVIEVDDDIHFIHSASSIGVSIAKLSHPYWNARYRSARRPQKFVQQKLVSLD